jgi:ATP-binding cassette subfamily B (MDR/TAP) protein 1
MFMTLGLASFVVYPSQTYLFSVAGCKLIQRIRSMCFEKVVHMEVSWFDEPEHSSGEIGARLSADAAIVRALVGDSLSQLVQNIATAVAGLVIAFSASWQLALVILVLLPLIGLNGFVQIKFMKGFSADAKVHSLIHDLVFYYSSERVLTCKKSLTHVPRSLSQKSPFAAFSILN